MFQGAVLVFELDQFLFIPFEDIDLILEVANDDILLVRLNLQGRIEVG